MHVSMRRIATAACRRPCPTPASGRSLAEPQYGGWILSARQRALIFELKVQVEEPMCFHSGPDCACSASAMQDAFHESQRDRCICIVLACD